MLAHPLRLRILQALSERVASPVELARDMDERLPNVSYHVHVLLRHGCIRPAGTRPRRGATEHFYRAVTRPVLGDREWRLLPAAMRDAVARRTLEELIADAAAAADDGALARDDVQVVRALVTLDDRGWAAMADLMASTLDAAMRIQSGSDARGAAQADVRCGELGLLLFERPARR